MPGSRFPERDPGKRAREEQEEVRRPSEYGKKFTREDFQDIAKFGGDILKRTVHSGLDAIKEVKDGLPKEAGQYLSVKKDEIMKGLSKEMAQSLVSTAVDKVFSLIRQHKVEISVRLKRDEDPQPSKQKKSSSADGSKPNEDL